MKTLIAYFCFVAALIAADPIPDSNKPNGGAVPWLVGTQVGVPGGIPSAGWTEVDVTTLGVATGNSRADNTSALNAAIATYKNGSGVVLKFPAGTFNLDGFGYNQARNIAVRGAGMFSTTLDVSGISFGQSFPDGNNFAVNPTGTVTAGFTRGSTSITVTDNGNGSPFRANEFIRCIIPNDTTIPMLMYNWTENLLSHQNYVTAVTNNGGGSWTLTLSIPVLKSYSGTITITQPQSAFTGYGAKFTGLEDFTLNSNGGYSAVAWYGLNVGTWAKNVRITNAGNYPFNVNETVGATITGCFVQGSTGWGPSHMGVLVNAESNGVLVEDTIVWQNYAGFGIQTSSNIVFSHNFVVDCPVGVSSNHSPYPHHNAFEGNIFNIITSDGTHGGSSTTLVHRNWFFAVAVTDTGSPPRPELTWNLATGLPTNGTATAGLSAKRWTRSYAFINNLLGSPGYSGSGQLNLDGQPNIGNGSSSGYGTYRGVASTLSTRSSDSAGVVTAPTGHDITTGQVIDVYWATHDGTYGHSFLRIGVTVGTVSGNDIPISGGNGDVLPEEGYTVYVPTTNTAIISYPQDWNRATNRPHIWDAEVTAITNEVSATLNFTGGNLTIAEARAAHSADNGSVWSFQKITSSPGYAATNYFQGNTYMSGTTLVANSIASWGSYPVVGEVLTLGPSAYGFQELDLDVRSSSITRGNALHDGTPVLNAFLDGETQYNSYLYPSAPGFLAGYSFPVFDPSSPGTASVRRLPAADRYLTFLENGSFDNDTVSTPQFSPAPGTHPAGTEITITTSTTGATTHVTTDGNDPTTGSPTYSAPIAPSVGTTVVKSFAVKSGLTDSAIQSGTYILVNAPTAPSSLNATTASTTQVNLTWTDNSSTETGFRIERRVGAGSYSTVTTTAANATSYSNTGLTPATTYEYRVYAINVAGDSTASNTDTATTNSEGGGEETLNTTINQLTIDVFIIPSP